MNAGAMLDPGGGPSAQEIAERLAALIRIPTVTYASTSEATAAEQAVFARYREALASCYPRLFGAADLEIVGRGGLLLRLTGASAAGVGGKPVMLMAHQDVVPTHEDWERDGWAHPPYAGVIEDGVVFGRGALDDKGPMVVMLEAVESLLGEGWAPARDLYVLMGADEESHGACAVAARELLQARGIELDFVLDEGGAIALEAFPGVEREVAVVGASEKGIAVIRVGVSAEGGHASMPPAHTAVGILARALMRVESNPFPASLHDVSVEMFETLAPHMGGVLGRLLGRARLLRPFLAPALARRSPEMAALVRTTVAITQLSGSPAHNVLATRASAILNCRIAVGSSVAATRAYLEHVIGDDRVKVEVLEASEPSPVSPRGEDPRWLAIREAVAISYPDAVPVPYIMLAASDARHLAPIAPAAYRFAPLRMTARQRAAIHGIDERVEVASLRQGVTFHRALLLGRLFS